MRSLLRSVALILPFCVALHAAEKQPRKVLVELFSSQGCSSCPPAEEFLRKAVQEGLEKNAVVLTWHVNYWDYLGWQDTFASRKTTERQETYVRLQQLSALQTPQFFVANKPVNSAVLLERVKSAADDADIAIDLATSVNGSELRAEYKITRIDREIAWPDALQVVAVLFQRESRVTAKAGENRGTELRSINVVRTIGKTVAATQAEAHKIAVVFPIPDGVDAASLGVAVIVEDAKTLRTYACIAK